MTGDIWIMWNDDKCQTTICKEHSRYIHFVCHDAIHAFLGYCRVFMDILTRTFNDTYGKTGIPSSLK